MQDNDICYRVRVSLLDAILGKKFPVLDKGFIRVIDYMGSDSSVVQAARISYGEGTKSIRKDRGLIRYLLRHQHTTPFEMAEIKFHIRAPMDTWRQWVRHRTASINEYSTRYSIAIDERQETQSHEWRAQSQAGRQGSAQNISSDIGTTLTTREQALHELSNQVYQERIDNNVAREQARKDLPLSTYTEAYWKINLHNLLHFLNLRMALNAQLEIRSYAKVLGHIVSLWCPTVYEAFKDYQLNSVTLSALEQKLLALRVRGADQEAHNLMHKIGWMWKDAETEEIKKSRELKEYKVKLKDLGFLNLHDL